MSQADALEYFKTNAGYARMKDLKKRGIHPRVLRSFLAKGMVEKIKPGIYKLCGYHSSEHQTFVDLSLAMPRAVVCLYSALHFYGLCDAEPPEVQVAVPQGYRVPVVKTRNFQKFFFAKHHYTPNIEEIDLKEGRFRIYSREKCLIDVFRFKRRFGQDAAITALNRYTESRHRHLGRLLVLAREFGVYEAIIPHLGQVM